MLSPSLYVYACLRVCNLHLIKGVPVGHLGTIVKAVVLLCRGDKMWRLIEESTNDADTGNVGGAVASSAPAGEGGGEGGSVEEEGGQGDDEIAAATPAPNFAASFPDAAKVSQVHTR